MELANKIIETGKPVIIVMIEGRPRVITEIEPKVKGVLLGFLPGMEGGDAIADVIFGDVNPSGKLPITYPKYPNGITLYDYKPIEKFDGNDYNPLWPFGFGLSYTTFEYSNLRLNNAVIPTNGEVEVSIDVKNTGSIAGKEVVQLYLTDLYGSVTRPNKQLKGFEKVLLNPGETKTIKFILNKDHFTFIGQDNKKNVEPGDFKVTIENHTANFSLK